MGKRTLDRRDILIGGAALALAGCAAEEPAAQQVGEAPPPRPVGTETPPSPGPTTTAEPPAPPASTLPTRMLGKTGRAVSILGLGGVFPTQASIAIPLVERALALGVTYFDSAPIYGTEALVGEGLAKGRSKIFLTTKTMARTRDAALTELDQSLTKLRTDHLDLWLLHDIRTQNDIDAIFAPGGAIEAAQQALLEKKVLHIGFSGHANPVAMQAMLQRYAFDCVLMALNAADGHERPFKPELLPAAVAQGIGIIAMKVLGYGAILKAITLDEAISYVLTQPVSTAIIGVAEIAELEKNIDSVKRFKPLSGPELLDIEARALTVGGPSTFFRRGIWI